MTRVAPSHFMGIDAATRRNLELTQTLAGQRGGSLLAGIDRTVTACGARMLAGRLAAPLTDVKAIAARHDAVECFAKDSELRRRAREALRAAPDIARALGRLSVARGGPRDLANLRDGVEGGARAARCPGQADAGRRGRRCHRHPDPKPSPRCRACRTGWNTCWWTSRPIWRAMAASSSRARMRRWTSCAACATNPAASSPGWKASTAPNPAWRS